MKKKRVLIAVFTFLFVTLLLFAFLFFKHLQDARGQTSKGKSTAIVITDSYDVNDPEAVAWAQRASQNSKAVEKELSEEELTLIANWSKRLPELYDGELSGQTAAVLAEYCVRCARLYSDPGAAEPEALRLKEKGELWTTWIASTAAGTEYRIVGYTGEPFKVKWVYEEGTDELFYGTFP